MNDYLIEMRTLTAKSKKMEKVQADFAKDAISEEELKEAIDGMVDKPKKPVYEQLVVDDVTSEALTKIMLSREAGTLLMRDELSSLFGKLGAKGCESERQFYLKSWSNDTITVDRIGRSSILIKKATLGIYGNIQESVLRSLIDESVGGTKADGFLPRFQCIGILSGKNRDIEDRFPNKVARNEYNQVIKDFVGYTHETMRGTRTDTYSNQAYYSLGKEALKLFNRWSRSNRIRIDECDNSAIESHLAKLPKLVAAITLIFHLIELKKQTYTEEQAHYVQLDTIRQSLKLTEAFTKHALYLYNTKNIEEDTVELLEEKILEVIYKQRHLFPMSSRELGRKIRINKSTPRAKEIKEAIENSNKIKSQTTIIKRVIHLK